MSTATGRPRFRRHVADLLSLANFAMGGVAIALALQERYALSLLCVALGALFDGLDGAAARRWGGSRCGVLADDIADAVTYGIAPAVALWKFLGGAEGLVTGLGYALFTLTRLVHFTLDKAKAEPGYFRGVPSTLGGVTVLCALVAWQQHPLLVALAVGAVSVKMVAFSTRYRHLGRWFAARARHEQVLVASSLLLSAVGLVLVPPVAASLVLFSATGYLLWPSIKELRNSVLRSES